MKKQSICLICLLAVFSSCESWLDVRPETKIKSDDLLATEQGFRDALVGVYTLMKAEELYARELTFGFIDAVTGQYDTYNNSTYNEVSQWKYESSKEVRTQIDAIWSRMYNVVANLNNIIGQIDQQRAVFKDGTYEIIKGEALGLRAFIHFDLLRLFAPADLSQPAIPYAESLDHTIVPLYTGKEVIEKVKTDLQNALELLQQDPIHTGEAEGTEGDNFMRDRSMHFNYYAVKGLLARVYLYAKEYTAALSEAREVIEEGGNRFPWVLSSAVSSLEPGGRDYTFSTEHIFALNVVNLKEIADTWFFSALSQKQLYRNSWNFENMYEQETVGGTDYRLVYISKYIDAPLWGYVLYKYYQPENYMLSYARRIPLIRRSEMYYIAAECCIGRDNQLAAGYLNEVRRHRGIAVDLPANLTDEMLQEEVLKEYCKEFQGEGQLFYYCKRHQLDLFPGTWTVTTAGTYVLPVPEKEIEFGNR